MSRIRLMSRRSLGSGVVRQDHIKYRPGSEVGVADYIREYPEGLHRGGGTQGSEGQKVSSSSVWTCEGVHSKQEENPEQLRKESPHPAAGSKRLRVDVGEGVGTREEDGEWIGMGSGRPPGVGCQEFQPSPVVVRTPERLRKNPRSSMQDGWQWGRLEAGSPARRPLWTSAPETEPEMSWWKGVEMCAAGPVFRWVWNSQGRK